MKKDSKQEIQRIGTSLYVCVPQVYAEQNNLEKGDQVDIFVDQEGNLVMKKVEAEVGLGALFG